MRAKTAERELVKTRAALEVVGKAQALLELLSESADAEPDVEQVIVPAVTELAELISTATACRLLGRPRASHYRARRATVPRPRTPRPAPPNALTAPERTRILDLLASPRFCDTSVTQAWATLLEEGVYLASRSTMHRLLRAAGQAGDGRRQATHPPRVKPELLATPRGGQVWSWDITKLRGPDRGVSTSCSTSSAATSSAGRWPPARTPTWPAT